MRIGGGKFPNPLPLGLLNVLTDFQASTNHRINLRHWSPIRRNKERLKEGEMVVKNFTRDTFLRLRYIIQLCKIRFVDTHPSSRSLSFSLETLRANFLKSFTT